MSSSKNLKKTIKWLSSTTSEAWVELVIAHPVDLLIDHAHCERKAAGAALQIMFRYLSEPGLAEILSPLVREEMEHFERVLSLLKSKGHYLKPLPAPPYGALLAKQIRHSEPDRMLDNFLIAGLIEARSHERMSLLAEHSYENDLKELYRDLLASEARHFGCYWLLAEKRYEREVIISRLEELAGIEAKILGKLHPHPRMHS